MVAQKWAVDCERPVKGVQRLVHPICTGNDFFPVPDFLASIAHVLYV
jgi:hypothetical protein